MTETWLSALALDSLPAGSMQECTIGGQDLVLCHTKEGVHALANVCTHAYARLSEGRLRGLRLVCPLHGASFDVRDGRVLGAPALRPLATHRVRIVDGQIEIAIGPAPAKPGQ